jgi:hypothetical protein
MPDPTLASRDGVETFVDDGVPPVALPAAVTGYTAGSNPISFGKSVRALCPQDRSGSCPIDLAEHAGDQRRDEAE